MKKLVIGFGIVALTYGVSVVTSFLRQSELHTVVRSVRVSGKTYAYRIYLPPTWNSKMRWSTVLFLHGAGERGNDNLAQTKVGIGPALARGLYNAVVVMPQCPDGRLWTDQRVREMAMAALRDAVVAYNGDERRVYLTGISMGGYGAWSLAYHYPGKFAAVVPIAGGVRYWRTPSGTELEAVGDDPDLYADIVQKIGDTPVWAFGGRNDTTVPVEDQHALIVALRVAGNLARETIYEDLDHHAWDRAYGEPNLIDWLREQRQPLHAIPVPAIQ